MSTWGPARCRTPFVGGFRHATAPGFPPCPDGGPPDATEHFALRTATVNSTSWSSVVPFLRRTECDLVLLQEHRLGPEEVDDKAAWARRNGWHALFLPAEKGPHGGWSAGVAILARKHLALSLPHKGTEVIVPSRAVMALVEAPGHRPFHAASLYLHDGEGLSARNMGLLSTVGAAVGAQGEKIPFLIGGDFQVSPQTLAQAGFAGHAAASVVASGCPLGTCRTARTASEIDYFVASGCLSACVASVSVDEAAATRPHRPVVLTFRPRATSLRTLVVRKPPPIGTDPIIGPTRDLVDWSALRSDAADLVTMARDERTPMEVLRPALSRIYERWSDAAETELAERAHGGSCLPKRGLRGRAPVLVWRSVLPERRQGDDDDALVLWRRAANAAVDMQRVAFSITERGRQAAADDAGDGSVGQPRCAADGDVDGLREGRLGANLAAAHEQADICAANIEAAVATARGQGRVTLSDADDALLDDFLRLTVAVARATEASPHGRLATLDAEDAYARIVDLRARIAGRLEEVAKVTQEKHLAGWTEWMRRGINEGARNAHRYNRLPEQWRPTTTTRPDGIITADPSNLVDGYRRKYAARWNGPDDGGAADRPRADAPWHKAPRCALPRPSASDIRAASKSFSKGTAVAFDGFALRHYAMLPDDALETLADIIVVVELVAELPTQLNTLLMPLIGKSKGGHRAITTAPSLYRLWARLRRDVTQEWERRNDRPFFAAGKGRKVHDVVWRQAIRAEAGAGSQKASAAVLWDMESFFDTINRARLWTKVQRHDFPIVVARLTMAVYDAPRIIALDGRLSRPLFARNGVPAGCGFAMALTRLYCIDAFDDLAAEMGTHGNGGGGGDEGIHGGSGGAGSDSSFDAYVDDLVVTANGSDAGVVNEVCSLAEFLLDKIHGDLACSIEKSKAAVVASSPRVAAAIARRLGAFAGNATGGTRTRRSAVNLGIDFAPGRRRTAHASSARRSSRLAALRKRGARLRKARRPLGNQRHRAKVFATGMLPAAVYDAAVNGVSDSEAVRLRRVAALAFTPRAKGRSLTIVSAINGIPTWKAEVEPIVQYARQVWAASLLGPAIPKDGSFTLSRLSSLWRQINQDELFVPAARGTDAGNGEAQAADGRAPHADPDRRRRGGQLPGAAWHEDHRKRNWNAVRGPVGAAILSLHRLGWAMTGPFTVTDDRGEEIALTRTPPAMLALLLRDATRRAAERYVGAKMAERDETFRGRRVCFDHVINQIKHDRRIDAHGKAAYSSVLCGAVMTYRRAANGGYLVADRCPLCGAEGDTIMHRIWACNHHCARQARDAVAPAWLQAEVARGAVSKVTATTGLIAHPGDVWPGPATCAAVEIDYGYGENAARDDSDSPALHGQLYVDGSCSSHVVQELKRAAASVVAREPGGEATWRMRLPVPAPLPQTSQSAEFATLPLVLRYLNALGLSVDVASDCANVVRSCGVAAAAVIARGKAIYGGLLRQVMCDPSWRRLVTVRKVPAHVRPEAQPEGPQREDAIGNDMADTEAKRARMAHPEPPPAVKQQVEADLKRAKLIIRTIAAVSKVFPPMPTDKMVRRPPLRDGARIHGDGGHRWCYAAGLWRCEVCWRLSTKPQVDAATAHSRCPGPKPSLEADRITALGHTLAKADGELSVLFCTRCGAFAARRAYGLATRCTGIPTKAGGQALNRIRRGLQPWRTRHDAGGARPTLGARHSSWSCAEGNFVNAAGGALPRRRRPIGAVAVDGYNGGSGSSDGTRGALSTDVHMQGPEVQADADDPMDVTSPPVVLGDGEPAVNGGSAGRGGERTASSTGDDVSYMSHAEARLADAVVPSGGDSLVYDDGARIKRRRRVGSTWETRACGPADYAGGGGADRMDAEVADALTSDAAASADAVAAEDATASHTGSGHVEAICDPPHAGYLNVSARAGPGGPPGACSTDAVAARIALPATASVAAKGAAALPHRRMYAWSSREDCGKAANGPPGGCAAPSDRDVESARCQGQVMHPPLTTPKRPGAGTGVYGRDDLQGDGGRPAELGKARRRDGTGVPVASPSVARRGAAVTGGEPTEQPLKGWSPCTLVARNGCRDLVCDDGADDTSAERDGAPMRLEDGRSHGGEGLALPGTSANTVGLPIPQEASPQRDGGHACKRRRLEPHHALEEENVMAVSTDCRLRGGSRDHESSGLDEGRHRPDPHDVALRDHRLDGDRGQRGCHSELTHGLLADDPQCLLRGSGGDALLHRGGNSESIPLDPSASSDDIPNVAHSRVFVSGGGTHGRDPIRDTQPHPDVPARPVPRVHGGGDDERDEHRRDPHGQGAIRGQLTLPGPCAADPACGAAAAAEASAAPAPIRGPDDDGLGPNGDVVDSRAARAQARLQARHSHISISLADHAERVAAKRARDALVPVSEPQPAAAQRLEALRRRVAARAARTTALDDVRPRGTADGLAAHGGAAATSPEAGAGALETGSGTIEVQKIQWDTRWGIGGRADTASGGGGGGQGSSSSAGVADAAVRPANAAAAAACHFAWHANVAEEFR